MTPAILLAVCLMLSHSVVKITVISLKMKEKDKKTETMKDILTIIACAFWGWFYYLVH